MGTKFHTYFLFCFQGLSFNRHFKLIILERKTWGLSCANIGRWKNQCWKLSWRFYLWLGKVVSLILDQLLLIILNISAKVIAVHRKLSETSGKWGFYKGEIKLNILQLFDGKTSAEMCRNWKFVQIKKVSSFIRRYNWKSVSSGFFNYSRF